jgi:hypothetical protein
MPLVAELIGEHVGVWEINGTGLTPTLDDP